MISSSPHLIESKKDRAVVMEEKEEDKIPYSCRYKSLQPQAIGGMEAMHYNKSLVVHTSR